MFENLLYIFSKDNGVINNYIKETESIREIKKLKLELHKRDTELKILQRRYDKLLNNCIEIELNKKLSSKLNRKLNSNEVNEVNEVNDKVTVYNLQDKHCSDNDSIDEYEKI
jgi:hypothetical protein